MGQPPNKIEMWLKDKAKTILNMNNLKVDILNDSPTIIASLEAINLELEYKNSESIYNLLKKLENLCLSQEYGNL